MAKSPANRRARLAALARHVTAFLALLGRPLAVPRDRSVMGAGGRYAHACYGAGFLDTLDLMARPEVRLIEDLSRGYSFAARGSAPSTVRPSAAFLALFPFGGVTWRDFAREAEP